MNPTGSTSFTVIMNNGSAYSTIINGGWLYVRSNSIISDTIVNSVGQASQAGHLYISSTASAINTTINKKGILRVYNGGAITSTYINTGGSVVINANASSIDMIMFGGTNFLAGTALNTQVSGGKIIVSSGGTIISPTILSGTTLTILSGGTAISVVSNPGATFDPQPGSIVE